MMEYVLLPISLAIVFTLALLLVEGQGHMSILAGAIEDALRREAEGLLAVPEHVFSLLVTPSNMHKAFCTCSWASTWQWTKSMAEKAAEGHAEDVGAGT